MKRLFFFALLFLLYMPLAQAQRGAGAAIVVESQRGEFFQLAVGGRMINPVGTYRVAVTDLPPGRHILDIRVLGRRRAQRITAEVRLAPDYETVFVLEPTGRGNQLILRKLEEIPISRPQPTESYPDCRYSMSEENVNRTLRFMKDEGYDDRRLEIAKGEIKLAGGILTEDLYRFMRALSFEDRKVALAKYAYEYVCDRDRFSRVFDAFEFSSGRRELQDFLYKK